MAEFRLRKDAETWFKHIAGKPPFATKFDLYYLCLLLGIVSRRVSAPTDAPGFVDAFVEHYQQQSLLLIGLVLLAELRRLGCGLEERAEVRRQLARLVGPGGPSSEGVNTLNTYASGGFDYLQERYGDAPPFSAEEFLPAFIDLVRAAAEEEPLWAAGT
jgi:hypothetical protein